MIVDIERLGINGEGITKILEGENKGKICFVDFALPNEKVDIDIIKSKNSYCNAELKQIITKSKDRVEPKCKYFGMCGGCDIQHLSKAKQLEFKRDKTKDTILKIAKENIVVDDVVRLNDYNYRNKMVFPIRNIQDKLVVGMFEKNSHNIVDIEYCCIASDAINKVLFLSKNYFERLSIKAYDEKTKKGLLKYLVVREVDNSVLVTIVMSKKIDLKDYYGILSDNFSRVGLSIIISDSDTNILSGKYVHLFGLTQLKLNEFGVEYSLDNRGFLQVNTKIKNAIYQELLEYINKDDVVIDAYSGAGLLTAIISKKCKYSLGIEINESASNCAKELIKDNDICNIEFCNADVKDVLNKYLQNYKNSVLVLDPPRSGCDSEILDIILGKHKENTLYKDLSDSRPKKIIYISCNPATLARDISRLKRDYSVHNVISFEMFPQTCHIENLIVLERKC